MTEHERLKATVERLTIALHEISNTPRAFAHRCSDIAENALQEVKEIEDEM